MLYSPKNKYADVSEEPAAPSAG